MSEFWYTEYTMSKAHGSGYAAFSLFDGTHIFWLVLCVLFAVGISFVYRKSSERSKGRIRLALSVCVFALEVMRIAVEIATDQWRASSLPLQLCSINVFICLWYGIHPNKLAGNLLYALGMPGAAIALLSPSWTMLPINNFFHINSALSHVLLFGYPIMLIAGGFRPQLRELPKVLLCLVGMCAVIAPINTVLGTNFFFISNPYGNPITTACTNIFGENLFIIGYAIILMVLMIVLYAPFAISKPRNQN